MSHSSTQKLPRGQIGRWLLLLRQVHAPVPARSFSSLIFFSSVDQNLWSLVAVCVTNCQVSSILQKWSRASRPRWRYCSQCRKTVSAHHFSRHLRSHEIYGAAPSAGQSSASTTSPRASSAAPSSFRRHAAPVVPVARACMGRRWSCYAWKCLERSPSTGRDDASLVLLSGLARGRVREPLRCQGGPEQRSAARVVLSPSTAFHGSRAVRPVLRERHHLSPIGHRRVARVQRLRDRVRCRILVHARPPRDRSHS